MSSKGNMLVVYHRAPYLAMLLNEPFSWLQPVLGVTGQTVASIGDSCDADSRCLSVVA